MGRSKMTPNQIKEKTEELNDVINFAHSYVNKMSLDLYQKLIVFAHEQRDLLYSKES